MMWLAAHLLRRRPVHRHRLRGRRGHGRRRRPQRRLPPLPHRCHLLVPRRRLGRRVLLQLLPLFLPQFRWDSSDRPPRFLFQVVHPSCSNLLFVLPAHLPLRRRIDGFFLDSGKLQKIEFSRGTLSLLATISACPFGSGINY